MSAFECEIMWGFARKSDNLELENFCIYDGEMINFILLVGLII